MPTPKFYLRIVKNVSSFRKKKLEQIFKGDFRAKNEVGEKIPDLSLSLYRVDMLEDEALARVLLEHAAEIPLEAPDKNLVFLNVTDHMGSRKCCLSPLSKHFRYIREGHWELKMADENDLKTFIAALTADYEKLEKMVDTSDLQAYLAKCIQSRDAEWVKLVNDQDLDPSWFGFCEEYGCSLESLKNTTALKDYF